MTYNEQLNASSILTFKLLMLAPYKEFSNMLISSVNGLSYKLPNLLLVFVKVKLKTEEKVLREPWSADNRRGRWPGGR